MTRSGHDKVRKEASRWFARLLNADVRESEREAFGRWREEDPRRSEAYAGTERLWEQLDGMVKRSERLRQAVVDPAAASGVFRRAWRHPAVRYPVFFGAAASLVAVVALALVYLRQSPQDSPARTFATALGEQRTERLADGTTLRLNTESVIEVRMTPHRREVTLRTGEAAFDVAKDASRPFVVAAGDGTVTAVGTQFEVRNEAGTVAVTLMQGRVQVARTSHREVESLDPGQQASYSKNTSGIVTRNVDVAALTSWMSGRLEFRGTPLQDAVAEANRYSTRTLRVADPTILKVPVSGSFRAGDVEGMASAFEATLSIRLERNRKEVVLYGR